MNEPRRFNTRYVAPPPTWWQRILRRKPKPVPVLVEVKPNMEQYAKAEYEEVNISGKPFKPLEEE